MKQGDVSQWLQEVEENGPADPNPTQASMESTTRGKTPPEARVVVITNLHYFAKDHDVRNFLRGFRVIDFKRGVNPKTGKPSGTGYVLMATLEDAKSAIQARDGWKVLNRVVELKFAKKPPKVGEGGFIDKTVTRRSIVDGSWQAWEVPEGAQRQEQGEETPIPRPYSGPQISQDALFDLQLRESQKKPRTRPGVVLQKIPEPKPQPHKTRRTQPPVSGTFSNPTPQAYEAGPQSKDPKPTRPVPQGHQIRIAELFGKSHTHRKRSAGKAKPDLWAEPNAQPQQSRRYDSFGWKIPSPHLQSSASVAPEATLRGHQVCGSDADNDEKGGVPNGDRGKYQARVSDAGSEDNYEQDFVVPQSLSGSDGGIALPQERIRITETRLPGQWSLAMPRDGHEPPRDFLTEVQWYSFWQMQMRATAQTPRF
ncbi:hypothetical protein BDV96DRAFT_657250 [Lophiotrema nucula]|uniref:RRM domain-containing protein n=1 Tax=Lophiotrema nucula TaxID=690887 RepID=A0A6A5ZCC9_9PLEO|nr:hypothetical protein BDV96DRAFT_657250 [Lophiotrema nucula]